MSPNPLRLKITAKLLIFNHNYNQIVLRRNDANYSLEPIVFDPSNLPVQIPVEPYGAGASIERTELTFIGTTIEPPEPFDWDLTSVIPDSVDLNETEWYATTLSIPEEDWLSMGDLYNVPDGYMWAAVSSIGLVPRDYNLCGMKIDFDELRRPLFRALRYFSKQKR